MAFLAQFSSPDPTVSGKTVNAAVASCKDKLTDGQHGIGQLADAAGIVREMGSGDGDGLAPRTRMWRIRPFTNRIVNPITRLFAGWMPGFGLLTYVGRTTGRRHQLPINVFRQGDQYVFALTYGSDSQWVKNVLAAGGCQIRVRGRDVQLVEPELIVDPARRLVPRPLRLIGRLGRVTEFVRMWAA